MSRKEYSNASFTSDINGSAFGKASQTVKTSTDGVIADFGMSAGQ